MPHFSFDGNNIYYNSAGQGEELLLLHGNSVSSNMFKTEIEYYSKNYRVIYFDYAGHGKSDRLEKLDDHFWQYNAKTALALLDYLGINKVYVIGTSGGALTGLNIALLQPERIKKLIADSFLGLSLSAEEGEEIARKRTKAKENFMAQSFWKSMHGDDWEKVVDQDIDLMRRVGKNNIPLIAGDVSKITCPVLGVGSTDDELIPDIDKRLTDICYTIPKCQKIVFHYGKHPFMITEKNDFRGLAGIYLNNGQSSEVSQNGVDKMRDYSGEKGYGQSYAG